MAIFVFGSNLAGRHGKGAALEAVKNHGAIYGRAFGLQGQSFAIPTKDAKLRSLSLVIIGLNIQVFLGFATARPDLTFMVTAIGCGLAGYKPAQIGPMFKGYPENCRLPEEFLPYV